LFEKLIPFLRAEASYEKLPKFSEFSNFEETSMCISGMAHKSQSAFFMANDKKLYLILKASLLTLRCN